MSFVTCLQVQGKKWEDCSVSQRQVTDYFTRDDFGAKEVGFASVRSKRLRQALLDEPQSKAAKTKAKKGRDLDKVASTGGGGGGGADEAAYERFLKKHSKEIEVTCDV